MTNVPRRARGGGADTSPDARAATSPSSPRPTAQPRDDGQIQATGIESASSRPPGRRRRRWRWLLVVLAAAALWLAQRTRQQLAALPPLRTVQVENRDLRVFVNATGTVEPPEVVEVGTLLAGKVVAFSDDASSTRPLEIGSPVARGQVLAQLDRQLYEVELRKARAAAQLSGAEQKRLETRQQQAARELQRAERLRATNAESTYDQVATAHALAVDELAIAAARHQQALAMVEHAEIQLGRTTIRSPIDGVVIDRRVNLGQNVGPESSGLFLLAPALDNMRVRASVSETDIGRIHRGQSVSFTVDADREQVLTGRVEQVLLNARVQGNFVTYDVLIDVEGSTEKLLPQMTADVEFETARRDNAWLVPGESLRWWPAAELLAEGAPNPPRQQAGDEPPRPGDTAYIWVPAGDGRVRALRVEVGIDDGVHTEVIGKLKPDLPVVVGVVQQTTLARIIPSVKTLR